MVLRAPGLPPLLGYTICDLILLREPVTEASDELICHELCHVLQMQHHPLRMPLSYLTQGYKNNPHEREAEAAAAAWSRKAALARAPALPSESEESS